jgi:hypothetical protein
LLKEPDDFGVLTVEILPDANLPLPRAKPPLFPRAAVGDQPRDRSTGLCKHNFLSAFGIELERRIDRGLRREHSRTLRPHGLRASYFVMPKTSIEILKL